MLQSTTCRIDDWESLPLLLTVEQAGAVLRIGRSKAYEMTVEWERSAGDSGLPCIRVGSRKLVPRHALRQYIDSLIAKPRIA